MNDVIILAMCIIFSRADRKLPEFNIFVETGSLSSLINSSSGSMHANLGAMCEAP